MSARYPLRPIRPEIQLPLLVRRRANRLRNGARVLRVALFFFLVSFVLASALFTPVFLVEANRLDAAAGGHVTDISRFAGHLEGLFLGALVLAAVLVGLSAGVLLVRGACRATCRIAANDLPRVPSRCFLKGGFPEVRGV